MQSLEDTVIALSDSEDYSVSCKRAQKRQKILKERDRKRKYIMQMKVVRVMITTQE